MNYINFARVESRCYLETMGIKKYFLKIILKGMLVLKYNTTISNVAFYILPLQALSNMVFPCKGRKNISSISSHSYPCRLIINPN